MFYGYGYLQYILYTLPVLIFSLLAQFMVNKSYKKYSQIRNVRGLTGAMAAQAVLNHYGITNVQIARISGTLTDNFNPSDNTIYLSEGVFSSKSIASIGIACHEAGHAVQHAQDYLPNKIRTALVPVTNFGSRFGLVIAFIGYGLAFASYALSSLSFYLIIAGLALYGLTALFQFITLPVEFNASHRAVKVIEETGLLEEDEQSGAKKVLTAAALTYVAALATAIMNVLYYATRFLGSGNNRRR